MRLWCFTPPADLRRHMHLNCSRQLWCSFSCCVSPWGVEMEQKYKTPLGPQGEVSEVLIPSSSNCAQWQTIAPKHLNSKSRT